MPNSKMPRKASSNWERVLEACREALILTMQLRGNHGETADLLKSLSKVHDRLGHLAWERDDWPNTQVHLVEALRFAEQRRLEGETADVLKSLSELHDQLGLLVRNRNDLTNAQVHFVEALHLVEQRRRIEGETADVKSSLARSHLQIGIFALYWQRDKESAAEHLAEAVRQAHNWEEFAEKTRDALWTLTEAYAALVDISFLSQDYDDDEDHYVKNLHALRKYSAAYEETYLAPNMDAIRARLLAKGCSNSTAEYPADLELMTLRGHKMTFLAHMTGVVRWSLAFESFVECWYGARLGNAGDLHYFCTGLGDSAIRLLRRTDSKEFSSFRETVAGILQTIAEQVIDAVEKSGAFDDKDARDFFAQYLRLAVEIEPDEVPFVLSLIQGRDLAAMILDDLQEVEGFALPEAQRRYREARLELRKAALNLRVIQGGKPERLPFLPLGPSGRGLELDSENNDAALRLAQKAYDAAFTMHEQAKAELVLGNADYAFAVQRPDMRINALRGRMRRDDAIVMLVAPSPIEGDDPELDGALHAVVVRKAAAAVSIALPALAPALHYIPALESTFSSRGFRRVTRKQADTGASSDRDPAVSSSSPSSAPGAAPMDVSALDWPVFLQEHLWKPLQPHLSGVRDIHLITHGELHAVPWNVGRRHCRVYPGLLFYEALNHAAGAAPDLSGAIGLRYYTPSEPERAIPFVQAEAALVNAVWTPAPITDQYPCPANDNTRVDYVHLAGHGQAIEGHLDRTGIELGPEPTDWLGFQHIQQDSSRPLVVFLSACVVGRTKDIAGNPLGLVTSYLMRKTGFVVAPLAPIPDFYAPLLAAFFHFHVKSGESCSDALEIAKKLMRDRKAWPEPLIEKIRAAYHDVLQHLKDAGRIEHVEQQLADWIGDPDVADILNRKVRDAKSISPITDWLISKDTTFPAKPIQLLTNTFVGFG